MADLFSYFNESDLELTGDHLGHLNEESRLVGVVFNDVVIHVDEDPEAQKQTQKKVTPVVAQVGQCVLSHARLSSMRSALSYLSKSIFTSKTVACKLAQKCSLHYFSL